MNIIQFEELLNDVTEAYSKSSLKDSGYNYSLVGTQIKPNQPLIIGLNWGGGKTPEQTIKNYIDNIDKKIKFQNVNDMGSLSGIKKYLKNNSNIDYENSHIGWTNYCFFRTPTEKELMKNPEDLMLTNDIFIKLINIIQPSIILAFSAILRNYLVENKMISHLQPYSAKNKDGKNKYNGYKAILNNSYPIYLLPHPNAHVGNVARDYAWNFCFKK